MPDDDLVDLERAFAEAERTDDVSVHLALKARLVARHDRDALARHFDFVRRSTNGELRQLLARFFSWHGIAAVPFLEQALRDEAEPRDRATALQMLGAIGQRHRAAKAAAAAAARAHLDASSEVVRERAVMVLGWVGGAKDVAALSKILASDDASAVRAMAASQLVFLAEGSKAATERVVAQLAAVLSRDDAELDERVRDAVVDAAESLTKKRFGPKSDRAARAERARRALAPLAPTTTKRSGRDVIRS